MCTPLSLTLRIMSSGVVLCRYVHLFMTVLTQGKTAYWPMENVIGEPDKIFVNTYFPNKLCDWCKPIASKEEHDTQIILPAGGVTG